MHQRMFVVAAFVPFREFLWAEYLIWFPGAVNQQLGGFPEMSPSMIL